MTLYIDAFSGVSGDMLLGALLGVGAKESSLLGVVKALGLQDECGVIVKKRESYGISGFDVDIALKTRHEHQHRRYTDIVTMIDSGALPDAVKESAKSVFLRLGEAEARVHGVALDEIAFHEVGAVDSIADIVGCCALWHELGRPKLISSPLALGSGTVKCAHGVLPVPAPATLELVRGVPVVPGQYPFELTTPTGAALLTELCSGFGAIPAMTVRSIGYGLGKRDTGGLNALRAVLGEEQCGDQRESAVLLEANLDDMTPEELAFAAELFLEHGALDVWTQQVVMKKGRPGFVLSCLCAVGAAECMNELFFKHTTTLGVRRYELSRAVLERGSVNVTTQYGEIPVKVTTGTQKPEYNACARLARETGTPLREIREAALISYRRVNE